MRGKGSYVLVGVTIFGITPAYAGKSFITMSHSLLQEDHPRLCGEKAVLASRFFRVWGSPPPMRGKAVCPCFFQLGDGITPAYAGKSGDTVLCSLLHEDHPRLCGEKTDTSRKTTRLAGSPPPMRGKARSYFCWFSYVRITPAYAGKR